MERGREEEEEMIASRNMAAVCSNLPLFSSFNFFNECVLSKSSGWVGFFFFPHSLSFSLTGEGNREGERGEVGGEVCKMIPGGDFSDLFGDFSVSLGGEEGREVGGSVLV